MTISIVMMSYLGDYPGSRTKPIPKFNRAVQSVVDQTYEDWELIIVSDGCELTNREYEKHWSDDSRIKLIKTEKSESKWPGTKRQIGINHSNGEWICYLDSDDMFLPNRLSSAYNNLSKCKSSVVFDNAKTVIFDKTTLKPHPTHLNLKLTPADTPVKLHESINLPEFGENIYYYTSNVANRATGTWCIFHKRDIKTKWQNREKTGEDTEFIKKLKVDNKCEYLFIEGYIIRHSAVRGWDI